MRKFLCLIGFHNHVYLNSLDGRAIEWRCHFCNRQVWR